MSSVVLGGSVWTPGILRVCSLAAARLLHLHHSTRCHRGFTKAVPCRRVCSHSVHTITVRPVLDTKNPEAGKPGF